MYQKELNELIANISQLKNDRNYWLVRTMSGEYYDDFLKNNIIGIGWNLYKKDHINELLLTSENPQKALTEFIKKNSSNEDRTSASYAAAQIIRFMFEIKKNDVVIIPSANSDFLSVGYVLDNKTYSLNELRGSYDISTQVDKFRKVKWQKSVTKGSIEPELYMMLFSHHPISYISEYALYVDRLLDSLYKKNDEYHFIVSIQSQNKISGNVLFRTWLDIFELVDEFNKQNNLAIDTDGIETKINVQSPGFIEFICTTPGAIVLIGIILVMLIGGGLESNNKFFPFKLKTDGLIKALKEFLNDRSKRKMVEKLVDKSTNDLNIRNPESIIQLIDKLSNEKNDKKD
jgi:restriction system protein